MVDRQTRAFFISLMVYNANLNLYAVVNFRFELTRAGNLIPRTRSTQFRWTLQELFRHDRKHD